MEGSMQASFSNFFFSKSYEDLPSLKSNILIHLPRVRESKINSGFLKDFYLS